MADLLSRAVQRHRAAQESVVTARAAVAKAQADVRATRAELHAAIAAAVAAGMRQVDLVQVTGLKREQIRRIARAAGVE